MSETRDANVGLAYRRSIVIGAWALAFTMATVILWTLPRGLDLMDEGFYLLEMRDTSSWRLGLIPVVLRALRVPETWWVYRILRLVLASVGCTVFGWGLVRYLRSWNILRPGTLTCRLVWPVLFWGACVAQTVFPKTVSYNDMNSALLMTGAGCLLNWLAGAGNSKTVLFGSLLGVSLALGYEVKFPSAVLMAAATVGIVLLSLRPPWRSRCLFLIAVLAGCVAGALLMQARLAGSVRATVQAARSVAEDTSATPNKYYDARRMLFWALDQMRDAMRLLFRYFGPTYLAAFAGAVCARKASLSRTGIRWWWLTGAVGALGSMVLFLLAKGWRWDLMRSGNHTPRLGALYAYAILLLAGSAYRMGASGWGWWKREQVGWLWVERGCAVLMLLALPFVAALGSDYPLVAAGVFLVTPWMGLLVWVAARIEQIPGRQTAVTGLIGLVAVFSMSHVVSGFVMDGFRLNSRAWQQRTSLSPNTALPGLRVTPELAQGIEWAAQILRDECRFRKGDPVLALYDMAGLVYAVGGRMAGGNWYSRREWKAADNARSIRTTPQTDLERAVLLLNGDVQPEILAVLEKRGMPFPDAYTLIDQKMFPDPWTQGELQFRKLSIWKPTRSDQ